MLTIRRLVDQIAVAILTSYVWRSLGNFAATVCESLKEETP